MCLVVWKVWYIVHDCVVSDQIYFYVNNFVALLVEVVSHTVLMAVQAEALLHACYSLTARACSSNGFKFVLPI
jgi:hypothetical protein